MPVDTHLGHRQLYFRLVRLGYRDLYAANLHLPSGSRIDGDEVLKRITQLFEKYEGNKIFMWDFNDPWNDAPIARYIASGVSWPCESELEMQVATQGWKAP